MSNLSVLGRNMLAGIQREESRDLFLRGLDRDRLKAELCAWEWDVIAEMIDPMIGLAQKGHALADDPGVMEFIRERHFRRYFPGN